MSTDYFPNRTIWDKDVLRAQWSNKKNYRFLFSGRLHGTIIGLTGRSDWSARLVGPTIISCKRFVRPVGRN